MKKLPGILGILAAIQFSFAITDLDFNNPAFADNTKAYILLIIGVVFVIAALTISKKHKARAEAD